MNNTKNADIIKSVATLQPRNKQLLGEKATKMK